MNIKDLLENEEEELILNRRFLHANPELGCQLPITSDFICKKLDEYKIDYVRDFAVKSSVIGLIEGGLPGPTVAFRADMDGLPLREETGLDFQSENGNMHACGHDGHVAVLLAAGKIINENRQKLESRLVLVFQPGEEDSIGAKPLVEAGLLESYRIESIYALHLGNMVKGVNGTAYINPGPSMACSDSFKLKIKGKASHGAYPEKSIDPITIGAHIALGLQNIVSRELAASSPAVISLGSFQAGSSYNIIPESVHIEGTARAIREEDRQYIARRIGQVAQGIASAYGASIDYDYHFGPAPLVNNRELALRAQESIGQVLGQERSQIHTIPSMGGEDFSYYLEEVPGLMIFFENILALDSTSYPHHNSRFALDESYLIDAVAIFLSLAFL